MQGTTGQQKTVTLEQALNDLVHRSGRIVVANEMDAGQIDGARRAVANAVPAVKFLIHRINNLPRQGGLIVPGA